MSKNLRVDRSIIKKVKLHEAQNDFQYWQNQPFEKRLEALEMIREDYHRWKYGSEPGFQRIYSVIKR